MFLERAHMRIDRMIIKFRNGRWNRQLNGNALRLSVLSTLIGMTGVAVILSSITSCKSTTSEKIEHKTTAVAEPTAAMNATAAANPAAAATTAQNDSQSTAIQVDAPGVDSPLSLASPGLLLPGSPSDARVDMEKVGEPELPGGPVAGIEVWQDNKVVSTIMTGKQVLFKMTDWTRDTGANSGCAQNRGIVQASWTIGSKPAADVQRFAGQECRPLDYSGMFTKAGNITVNLEVLSGDGEMAQAAASFPVMSAE